MCAADGLPGSTCRRRRCRSNILSDYSPRPTGPRPIMILIQKINPKNIRIFSQAVMTGSKRPRGDDKGAPQDPHFPPVVKAQQQVDEKDQHPHGAGLKPSSAPMMTVSAPRDRYLRLTWPMSGRVRVSEPSVYRRDVAGWGTVRSGAQPPRRGPLDAAPPGWRSRWPGRWWLHPASDNVLIAITVNGTPETSAFRNFAGPSENNSRSPGGR